jgi:hypothetical protein
MVATGYAVLDARQWIKEAIGNTPEFVADRFVWLRKWSQLFQCTLIFKGNIHVTFLYIFVKGVRGLSFISELIFYFILFYFKNVAS